MQKEKWKKKNLHEFSYSENVEFPEVQGLGIPEMFYY